MSVASSIAASSNVEIELTGYLINSKTLKPVTGFVIETFDASNFAIDAGTGGTITMTTLSKFTFTLNSRSSSVNGGMSNYQFKINFQIPHTAGVFLFIALPA